MLADYKNCICSHTIDYNHKFVVICSHPNYKLTTKITLVTY